VPNAPGPLEAHYAPNAKVRLMDAKALQTALEMLDLPAAHVPAGGEVRATIAVYARSVFKGRTPQVLLRKMPADAAVAAHELFSVLRECDDAGVKLIWVETPPEGMAWDGVRDRLQRASAA